MQELELQIKLNESDYEREVKEMKSQMGDIELVKQSLLEKIKVLELSKSKMMEEHS